MGIAPPPISLNCTGVILVEACGHSPPSISLYCTGVILVEACGHSSPPPFLCTAQVLFSSRGAGITPPPFFVEGPGGDWDCVFSLHVVGYPEESITFLRLVVVASSRLPIVSVGLA